MRLKTLLECAHEINEVWKMLYGVTEWLVLLPVLDLALPRIMDKGL